MAVVGTGVELYTGYRYLVANWGKDETLIPIRAPMVLLPLIDGIGMFHLSPMRFGRVRS